MIELKNVTKIYNIGRPNALTAIDNLTLDILSGEFVAIMGKSGSGKSTLLHLLASIDLPTSGDIIVNGIKMNSLNDVALSRFRNKNIGIVLQEFFLINELSVLDNVLVPLSFSKIKYKAQLEKAVKILTQLDIEKYIKTPVSELSGGEKQRVAIARALINEPNILLADEPTGSLDEANSENILDLFKRINNKLKCTIVIVTHNLEIANNCDRIITIRDGKLLNE
jgi:putative ABC transport system ATP-binding protein